ncbi:unnamed protein product [Withania somnifera]
MAATSISLFLAFLWFSHAIGFINAVPITRSANLVMEIPQEHYKVLENNHMVKMEEKLEVEETTIRRVLETAEIDNHDYPGSGANNRHTPRLPLGRSCAEC